MAKDRLTPCLFYLCEGGRCEKGRYATHFNRCQSCSKYVPRAKVRVYNKKKTRRWTGDDDYKREIKNYC